MGTVKAWTIPGRSGAMWTQPIAVAARTCPTLRPGFQASLGHMKLVLHQHVAIMGDSIMGDTAMVGTTMLETVMEDTTMVVTPTVATIMVHPAMVDLTLATIVDQITGTIADPQSAEEPNV